MFLEQAVQRAEAFLYKLQPCRVEFNSVLFLLYLVQQVVQFYHDAIQSFEQVLVLLWRSRL